MEKINDFFYIKNINFGELLNDFVLLILSGILILLIGSNFYKILPDNFWLLSLSYLKKPDEGIATIGWIFFTLLLYVGLKNILIAASKISRQDIWHYSPPLDKSNLIYQGWLEIKNNNEIFLTNSSSGLLFKKPWIKNFQLRFKFNFEYLETTVVEGIWNENLVGNKIHKFNYLGVLFRAQSLEDYFMFSIGVLVNIDDYRQLRDTYNQDENSLFKHKEFAIVITPHIRINGAWERLGGRPLGAKIKVNDFTEVLCIVTNDTATLEIDNNSLTWNLPTNFDPTIDPNNVPIDTNKQPDAKLTAIPFRLKKGRIGFRSYHAEHSIIKDVVISKI